MYKKRDFLFIFIFSFPTKDPNIALLSARYLVQLKQFIFFFFIFFFFKRKGKRRLTPFSMHIYLYKTTKEKNFDKKVFFLTIKN
jgi:hypothetical protein